MPISLTIMHLSSVIGISRGGGVDSNTLIGIFLALLGITISLVIWAASTHAARIQARDARLVKESLVDVSTLEQIKKVYEGAIAQLEEEIGRLRSQARTFEDKTIELAAECQRLRAELNARSTGPPDAPNV